MSMETHRMRLVIAGISDAADLCRWNLQYEELVAVVDLREEYQGLEVEVTEGEDCLFCGKVAAPEDLSEDSFDYVVFPDLALYYHGGQALVERGFLAGQIVTYGYYARYLRGKSFYALRNEWELAERCAKSGIWSILDFDLFFQRGQIYTKSGLQEKGENFCIEGIAADRLDIGPMLHNLYDSIWERAKDVRLRHYDLMVFAEERDVQDCLQLLQNSFEQADAWAFFLRKGSAAWRDFPALPLEELVKIECVPCVNGAWLMLRKRADVDFACYVVQHKKCKLPCMPQGYRSIHAGKQGAESLGIPGDDTGEEISRWNPFLNELTAMYWIWKNTRHAYVGMAHYHRFLAVRVSEGKSGDGLRMADAADVRELLGAYDIIVGEEWVKAWPNEALLIHDVGADAAAYGRELILDAMKEYQPAYVEAFYDMAAGQGFFRCNMFFARKFVFDAYCDWLFSFLLPAVEHMDAGKLHEKERRVLGFWGERMLTVWLLRQNLRIKELPFLELPHEG